MGEGVVACNQVLYNLSERDAEHLLQAVCERHKIAFVGYSPLGSGQFPEVGTWRGDVLAGIFGGNFLEGRPNQLLLDRVAAHAVLGCRQSLVGLRWCHQCSSEGSGHNGPACFLHWHPLG